MTASTNATPLTFLEADASCDQLLRAMASNHRQSWVHGARERGGEVHRENGATWIYTPGSMAQVTISFPRLSPEPASEQIDAIMRYCRRHRPLRSVSCWTLVSGQPPDLGARLLARGFEWGWRPHWMGLDFRRMRSDHPRPHGLRVGLIEDELAWTEHVPRDLPYSSRENTAHRHAGRERPRRSWHFGAWLDGKPVGHISLYLTTGRLGVAGIYGTGVIPAARNQCVGRVLTLAACQHAQRIGCHHALLNATGMGEPAYRAVGFESLGYGQTWWLHHETLEARPPGKRRVAFAEAVGRGDIEAMNTLGKRLKPTELDAPLPGGLTLIGLAVQTGQHASAEWLVEHGAALDVLAAWDLGWKERVPQLLARSPELANARSGAWEITPLHEAASRNDLELARLLLAADPDLEIQDAEFHSTPLGWARHFQRAEIIELIERHQGRIDSA